MTLSRTPRQLKQWIESLPLTDVRETVAQLHRALASPDLLQLGDKDRIELLETYRDVADEILMSYDDVTLRTLPLEPEQRGQLSQSITEIFLVLSHAYRTAIDSAVAAHESPDQSDSLLLATYRAMEYLTLAALYSCKLRADIPAVVWSNSKQLYLFADEHGVTDTKIRKATGHVVTPTVGTLFKQLLLFAIADPYRWPSADVHELFLALETCASFASLSSSVNSPGAFAYRINMENETPPQLPTDDITSAGAISVRWLDCAPALATIKQNAGKSGGSVDIAPQEREGRLLGEFYKRMRAPRTRTDPRTTTKHPMRMATGLEATCYFLADPERAQYEKKCNVIGGIEVCEDENSFEMSRWTAVNENVNGYMLVADTTSVAPEPPIGELFALADCDTNGAPRLRIGVVRWMRKPKSGAIYIGVELLEGVPQLTRCTRTPAAADGASTAAIFFPPQNSKPPALLIPSQLYAPAATVCVEIDGEKKLLDMDLPLTETPLYVLAAVFLAKC